MYGKGAVEQCELASSTLNADSHVDAFLTRIVFCLLCRMEHEQLFLHNPYPNSVGSLFKKYKNPENNVKGLDIRCLCSDVL